MNPPPAPPRRLRLPAWLTRTSPAVRIALGYVGFAALYIYISDWAVTRLGGTPESIRLWQTIKGWGFVGVTGLLLCWVLSRVFGRMEAAQRQLQENEERLRLALAGANQGLYDLDVQTGEAKVSPEYATMLGYDPAEFHETNARWIERLHPDDREAVVATYRAYIEGRIPTYQVEFRQRTKSGDWKWILSLGKIVERDAQGRPRRMLGTHTDITERKQAEEALRASGEQYRRLFELESDALFLIDKETGQILEANAAATALYGYTHEELLARRNVDLSAEPDQTRAATTEQKTHVPTRWHRKKDGTVFPVEINASHFQLGGRPVHLAAIRDITERHRAQEALAQSERKWRLVVLNTPQIGVSLDPQGRIVFANRHLLDLTGWREAEVLGQDWFDRFIPEDQREQMRRVFRTVMEARDTAGFSTYENEILTRSGERRNVAWANVLTRDAQERVIEVTCLGIDLTERQRAERALHDLTGRLLRSQDEERRRLARELHDTTAQNLAALNMNLALLEQKLPPGLSEYHALLADCQALTDRAAQEIRTLSYLLHPPLLDEFGLVRAMRDYAEGFAQRSGLRVELDLPEDMERLSATLELALFRVLQESLGNVYRHSGSSVARIALRRKPDRVVLEIADEGRGLPPDWVAGNRGPAGVGILGMRERLRQLGGRLEIESGLLGVCVRATLPVPENGQRCGRES